MAQQGNVFFQLPEPKQVTFGQIPVGGSFEFDGKTFTKVGRWDAKPQRGPVSKQRVWLSFTLVTR